MSGQENVVGESAEGTLPSLLFIRSGPCKMNDMLDVCPLVDIAIESGYDVMINGLWAKGRPRFEWQGAVLEPGELDMPTALELADLHINRLKTIPDEFLTLTERRRRAVLGFGPAGSSEDVRRGCASAFMALGGVALLEGDLTGLHEVGSRYEFFRN